MIGLLSSILSDLSWLQAYFQSYYEGDSVAADMAMEKARWALVAGCSNPRVGAATIQVLIDARDGVASISQPNRDDRDLGISNRYEPAHDLIFGSKLLHVAGFPAPVRHAAFLALLRGELHTPFAWNFSWLRWFNPNPDKVVLSTFDRDVSIMKDLLVMSHISGDTLMAALVSLFYDQAIKVSNLTANPDTVSEFQDQLEVLADYVTTPDFWDVGRIGSETDPEVWSALEARGLDTSQFRGN